MDSKQNIAAPFFKSFVPSAESLVVGFCIATTVVVGRIIALSLNTGLLFPNLLVNDAENWGEVFISAVEPFIRFILQNPIAAAVAIAIFWAALGAGVYLFIGSTTSAAKEAKNIQDPTMRFYLGLFIWHVLLTILVAALTYLLLPFFGFISGKIDLLAQAATNKELLSYFCQAVLSGMLVLHLYLVLYRLFRRFYIY